MEIEEDGFERYGPPDYIATRGVPCLDISLYNRLVKIVPDSPNPTRLFPLTVGEAIRLFQWESPCKILGQFPEPPALAEEMVLDVIEGEREKELAKVSNFITRYARAENSCVPLRPVKPKPGLRPIEMLLDSPGYPVWRRFADICDQIYILLGSDQVYKVRS